ncbi:MAG: hypothetical protein H7Y31_15620 [Chitinophagaceae bacterium]|nr:hypothetical protein [Chitinophagaceae bacterium]
MLKVSGSKMDKNYRQSLIDLQEDLYYAEYAMNTWMQEFKIDSAKTDQEKRLAYLEKEKTKVLEVKRAIMESVSRADSLFKK